MNTRRLIAVGAVASTLVFASAQLAYADAGTWAAVADLMPVRVLLGLSGIVFAAALARGQAS